MAGVTDGRIEFARELLEAAEREFEQAQQEKGGAAVTVLRNACGKGWLAVLEAAKAHFIQQGAKEEELPDNERGRRYFVRRYMDRYMRREYESMRQTFHLDGYYEGIVEFEDMPDHLSDLSEFIDLVALGQEDHAG